MAETYPEFDITTWSGIFLPGGTPRELVAKVGADVGRVLARPDVRDRFAAQGAETRPGSPEQLADLVRRETALYANVIKAAGITPE
jgi:tripartite-type tricarboxylate transporter receptor subunit TctC